MTPEYWTALRLRFTVEGPNGERQVDTDKPYAVLGITEAGELVCGDGDGEAARQHSLVVASDAGIFACMLRDDMPACPYEFQDGEAFPIGSQQVYVNRIGDAAQPKPFALTLGYLAFFKERKQIGARRVLGPLTVVGRERPAKWRFKSSSIAPCHLGVYSDGDRAWAISLHRDNPVRIFGEPVATAALDLEHPAQFGNYRLLYFSNANAARIDDKRELTDKELYGPQHGAEFSSPTNSGSLDLETVGQSDEVTLTDPLMSGGLEYDELDGSSEDGEGGGDAEGSEQSDIQLSDPTWSVVDQQDDTDESPESAPPAMNADYVALQHELADVRGMIEAVHTDLAEKSQQERSPAADPEAIASSQQTVRAEIEALRADFQQRQAAAERHADELDSLLQPLRTELADLRNALAAEQAAPREQVEQLSAETHDRVDELQSELAKVQNELTRIQAEQAAPREQVEQLSAETQDRVGELQSELAKVQNELTRIQAEQQRSDQAAAKSWREDLAALERQVSELLAAREQDAAALAEQTDKQAVTSQAAIESLRDELKSVRADLEQLPGEVPEDWREHVDQLRNKVLQLQAEAESREENTSLQSVDEQQSTELFQQEVKSLGDQLAQLREELRELRDSQAKRRQDADSNDALAALQDQVDSLQSAVKRQERREDTQAKSAEADEFPELRQELLETNHRLQTLSDSVRDLESNGDTEAEHAASELKEQLAALAEQVTASQSMLQTREADTDNALNTLREQVGELQGQSVDSQGEQQAAVETLRKEFATLQEQLAEIRSAQQADAGAVAEREKQHQLAVDALEQRAATLEDQVLQAQAELARASDGQADISALRADVKQIQDELKLQDEVATEQAGSQAEALQAFGRQLEELRADMNALQTSVGEAEQGMVQLANEQRQSSAGWKQGLESAQAQLQTEVERFQQEQQDRQDQRDQQDRQEVQRGQTCASCESLRQEVAELRESLEAIKEAEAERQRCAVESAGHRGAEPSATVIEPELVVETAAPSANRSLTVGAEATEQLRATRSDNDGAIVVTDDSDVIDMDEVAGVDAMDGAREADSVDGGSDGGSSTPDAPFVSLDGADAAVRTMEVLQRQNAQRQGMMGKALASWTVILWVGGITGLVGLVTAIVWRYVS